MIQIIKRFGLDIFSPNKISPDSADNDFVITLDIDSESNQVFISMYQESNRYDENPLNKVFINFRNFIKYHLKNYITLPKNKFNMNDSDIGFFNKEKLIDFINWIDKAHIYYNEFNSLSE